MITQLGGGGAVAWTVIDEETILGECLLLSEDEPENISDGFIILHS